MEHVDVIIVGAGQAGLSLSHELTASGVEHVVLERGRVGETWRHRHDTFCLVTPNWTARLPGCPYSGPHPDGFMARDEIVAALEDYARSFNAPTRESVMVTGAELQSDGRFLVHTRAGDLTSRALVLATGTFQRCLRPAAAESLPPKVFRIDVDAYRNEGSLPPGKVAVIGSGQSGAQVSEELCQAGREVVLACGKSSWVPRRLGSRDIFWWLDKVGFFDQTLESLSTPVERLASNPMATGRDGGHDLDLRTLQAMGVTLAGHFLGVEKGLARFAPDLPESVAWGDQRNRELMNLIGRSAAGLGVDLPPVHEPEPIVGPGPEWLDLSDFGIFVFAGGFRPGYHKWFSRPDAFDEFGFPLQRDGASTVVPGLFFLGVHFQRTRRSALLFGVGDDAGVVCRQVCALLATKRSSRG